MIGTLGRAGAVAAALAIGLSYGAPVQAAGCTTPDHIRVMIFSALFNNMVTYVAQDAGLYRKHCLDATLVPVGHVKTTPAAGWTVSLRSVSTVVWPAALAAVTPARRIKPTSAARMP